MLLCRRLLIGVRIPKLIPTHTIIRKFSPQGAIQISPPGHDKPSPLEILSPNFVSRPPEKWREAGKPFKSYTSARKKDRASIGNLSFEALSSLIIQSYQHRSSIIMDYLAADVVEGYVSNEMHRRRAALLLLSHEPDQPILIPTQRQVSLLDMLRSASLLLSIPHAAVLRLIKTLVDDLVSSPSDGELLDMLCPLFRLPLRAVPAPKGMRSMTYHPPPIVYIAFGLVHKLLQAGRDKQALEIFQLLVKSHHVPAEAVQYMKKNTSQNFAFIIRSTLVRASLHWTWHGRAIALLVEVIRTQDNIDAEVIELSVDTLYTALDSPSIGDLAIAGSLMRELDIRVPDFIIPDGMIRLFYERAKRLDKGSIAELLYKHTQLPPVLERVQYPPPRGPTLTWFMDHLTTGSRNMHLARLLAKQVVDGFELIPVQDRASFIILTAAHGFAVQARALWERYAQGRDRDVVVGNAAAMIRVVSLFSDLISRTRKKVDNMELGKDDEAEGIESLNREYYEQQLDVFSEFAFRVLGEFRQSIEPLEDAGHYHLTALARAYFVLGRVSDGFDTFKVILDRKEVPDTHDINVALSAMAEYSPRNAAGMIERMIERGVAPDAVTFGTVLHHSVVHGDMDLVCSLINRAQELDRGELSLKAVAALIRASVKMEDEDKGTLKTNLRRAMDIIRSMKNMEIVCTPNTGKYCIFASLHVDEPVMAFKFWDMLVKAKTEWDDREQSFQRRLIASMIRRHYQAGWLSRDRGMLMLGRLREQPGRAMIERTE